MLTERDSLEGRGEKRGRRAHRGQASYPVPPEKAVPGADARMLGNPARYHSSRRSKRRKRPRAPGPWQRQQDPSLSWTSRAIPSQAEAGRAWAALVGSRCGGSVEASDAGAWNSSPLLRVIHSDRPHCKAVPCEVYGAQGRRSIGRSRASRTEPEADGVSSGSVASRRMNQALRIVDDSTPGR
jgi:hypothetical protein